MKRRMKKITAILCVLSMLLTTVLAVAPSKKTEASGTTAPTVPASLKEMTFTDFGVTNGEYTSMYKQNTSVTNFNGMVFQGKINFPAMEKTHFKIGGTEAGKGIELVVGRNASMDYILVNDKTTATTKFPQEDYNSIDEDMLFTGSELTYKFTIQYVDNDDEGTNNDVRFGIWVNDTLLGGDYLVFEDHTDYMGNWMSIERTGEASTSGAKVAVASIAATPKTFPSEFKMMTLSDFGIANGTYTTEQHKEYTGTATSFDKTYFHAKLNIPTNEFSYIKIGGTQAGTGIQLKFWKSSTMHVLNVSDSVNSGQNKVFTNSYQYHYPYEVNFEFLAKEIDLKLTMQYVDSDGDNAGTNGKDDLKFGIWIDDKLIGGDFLYLQDYVDSDHSMGKWLSLIPASGSTGIVATSIEKQAVTFPTGLKMITFTDFGIANGNYKTGKYLPYTGSAASLDGTYFHAKMNIPSADGTFIKIGGTRAGTGIELKIYQNAQGVDIIHLKDSYDSDQTEGFAGTTQFLSTVEGKTFTGREIDLKLTIQFVDSTGGNNKNDVKFGIWVDDKLIGGEYRMLEDYVNTDHSMGKYLSLIPTDGACTDGVTVTSITKTVETFPTGLDMITFSDFGIANGTHTSDQYKPYLGNAASLDGTYFHAKMNIPSADGTFIKIGGKNAGTGIELKIYQNAQGVDIIHIKDSYDSNQTQGFAGTTQFTSTVEEMTFTGREIDLKLTIQFVDSTGGNNKNDVKFGIWVDDKLIGGEYRMLENYVDTDHSMGKWLSLITTGTAKTTGVTVTSITKAQEPFPTGLEMITFTDFGIANGTHTSDQYKPYTGNAANLGGTYFHAKVTFPSADGTHLKIGGTEAGTGIELKVYRDNAGNDIIQLKDSPKSGQQSAFTSASFSSAVEGITFTGREVDLKLTIQYVDSDSDGETDDVKFGIWVDDKLIGSDFRIFKNYVNTDHSMGKYLSLITTGTAKPIGVTVTSIARAQEPFPTGLEMITFSDFALANGTYKSDRYVPYADGDSLDGTYFHAKITFPSADGTHFKIGGTEPGTGIELKVYRDNVGNDIIKLLDSPKKGQQSAFSSVSFSSAVEGITFTGREVDFKLTIEYVDSDNDGETDDVKFGIWVDDKLIGGAYRILKDYVNTDHSMGNYLSLITTNTAKQNGVIIKSIERQKEVLPAGLKELSFDDFGIGEDFYSGTKAGAYEGKTLDGTVIKGKVTFSEIGDGYIIIGGKKSWGGFGLKTDNVAGKKGLALYDSAWKSFSPIKFDSDIAGVQLVGKQLELWVSIQYVDNDGDGKLNDVKLGLWFNEVLYNNKYIYLQNYTETDHSMGTWMTIVVFNNAQIIVGNPKQVDLAIFGLDANWKKTLLGTSFNSAQILKGYNPYTGDTANATPWLLVSAIALAVVMVSGYMGVKARKEQD